MSDRQTTFGTMLDIREAEMRLREKGAKITAQRHAVLEVLSGNRTHPTADELISMVRKKIGCVAPATIYNTLETLEELGFVRRIDGLDQSAHFDPDTSEHYHAICSRCSRVWDIDMMNRPAGLPESFRVTDIIIQGLCEGCTGLQ